MTSSGIRAAVGTGAGADGVSAVDAALGPVADGLDERPDLVVVFLGADHAASADRVGVRVTERLAPRHLIGVTAGAVIGGQRELEDARSVSVWAAQLPGASLTPLRFPPPADGSATASEWPEPPADTSALVLLCDPFTFPADAFLAWWEQVRPGVPVSGGLASGAGGPGQSRLLLDGEAVDGGAVAIALEGVRARTLVSQGCRPVGESYTVTRAERNLLQELGGEPPVDRIRETYAAAGPDDQALIQTGLHIGTAIDEYREAHSRGDFLVRGVLGAESGTGAIAVGDVVRVGQTVRFHVRDAASADEDLRELLADFRTQGHPAAALLFTCNGRGARLFGSADHDSGLVSDSLGGVPLAGFFCAGELGPIGPRSFLHGFTASLLVLDDATDT